jgi:hypothetical protein
VVDKVAQVVVVVEVPTDIAAERAANMQMQQLEQRIQEVVAELLTLRT